jgi:hypothetical protein
MPRSGGGGGGVRNYNTYVAPPIISPYGFGGGLGYGFGFGGGVGIMPFPIFGLGGIFNLMIIMFVLSVVLNTVRNFTSGNRPDRDDEEDDKW